MVQLSELMWNSLVEIFMSWFSLVGTILGINPLITIYSFWLSSLVAGTKEPLAKNVVLSNAY